MIQSTTVVTFLLVVGGTSLLAVTARRFRRQERLPSLDGWALADRGFGGGVTWFLLGGSVFTAYTIAAVPGLVYGVGALAFFALPYTVLLCPLAFVVLPRLWQAVRDGGHITVADYVKARYDHPKLALAVALTGILATMPYLALQLLGIRAVLIAGDLYPQGPAGDSALVALFAVLAVATYRHGLRAPAVISLVKGVAIGGAVVALVAVALDEFGGPGPMFAAAEANLPGPGLPAAALRLDPALYPAFATLALGSAMAVLMYPHLHTATFAATGADVVRRVTVALPAWTAVLGLFGLLGIAALAAGVPAPAGNAEAAVPMLVRTLLPAALTGAVFGAFVVGALVPAAVMSIAAATLFVRNVYVEYFHPTATPKHQTRIAKLVSLTAKLGAIGFVFGLRNQDAINLQLLGGVWILQTFPAVVLGLFTRLRHSRALLAGWAAGMITGTLLVVRQGFSAVVWIGPGDHRTPIYAALVALAVNLVVTAAAAPLLARTGRGPLRAGSAAEAS